MFGLPKTAIGEPVEFGRARINNEPTEVPYVLVKTMKNDKLLKSLFLTQGQGYNISFSYFKMFKTVQLISAKGKNKISITFPFAISCDSLAGMIKTKTLILEHQDLGPNARLTLELETFIKGLSDKWRIEIIPDYLLAKFKKEGVPMERFNLIKNQFIEKVEKNWVVPSE